MSEHVIIILDEYSTSLMLKRKTRDVTLKSSPYGTKNARNWLKIIDPIRDRTAINPIIQEMSMLAEQHVINLGNFVELWYNRVFLIEFLKTNGKVLQYAHDELQNDKVVVLTAVQQNGMSLEFASNELKSDREVVSQAVRNCGTSIQFASEELLRDRSIAIEAVENDGRSLSLLRHFITDRDVVMSAVSNHGWALEYASDELRNDKDIVTQAVKTNGSAIQFASIDIQKDSKMMKFALAQNDPLFNKLF